MNLTTQIEKKENAVVSVSVTVPKEEMAVEFEKTLTDYSKKVTLPGFRKGKAPKNMVYKKYKNDIQYNTIDNILNAVIKEVVDKHSINIFSRPAVTDMGEFSKDSDFNFIFEVEVLPSVELGNYKDIEYKKTTYFYKDSDIDERLESIQQEHAMVVDKEDEPAENKDRVTFDYNFFLIGKTEEEPEGHLHVTIGEDTGEEWLNRIVEDLEGKSINYKGTYDAIIPKQHTNENMAGKDGKIYIKITKIEKIDIPEIDDELAKDLEYENLEELKNKIKEDIKTDCDRRTEDRNISAIIEKVMAESKFEIPETLIQEETNHQKDYFLSLFGANKKAIEDMYKQDVEAEKKFNDNMRDTAVEMIKKELVMSKIVKQESIKATDEEKEKKVQEFADKYGISLDKMKEELNKNNAHYSIERGIEMEKLGKFLIDNSKFTEEEEVYFREKEEFNGNENIEEVDSVEDDKKEAETEEKSAE